MKDGYGWVWKIRVFFCYLRQLGWVQLLPLGILQFSATIVKQGKT